MSSKPPNPFKGLQSYTRDDYHKLFGRDADFIFMQDRVFADRTTLVFAGSGVGKTSFFEAKFIPEMERRHGEGVHICYHRQWVAGHPLDSIRQALGADAGEPLVTFFKRSAGHWILILDQFEELFQNPDYWTTSLDLREEISQVVRSDLPVSVVFSMREEFLGHLSFFDNKVPDVFRNYYRLKNPDPTGAMDIIIGTCASVACDSDGLLRLVADLGKVEVPTAARQPRYINRDSIFLPFLQLVCQSLWDRQPAPEGAPFRFLENYAGLQTAAGPISPAAQVLEGFCVDRLDQLPDSQQILASRSLDYLVTSQGAKRAYEAGALAHLMEVHNSEPLRQTLDALANAGILRTWPRDEEQWFELAHDMYAPVLYRWKERFQERRRKWKSRVFTAAIAAAAMITAGAVWWYSSQARDALAKALDDRAAFQELQQDRDQAIMLRLAALDTVDSAARRRAAAAVVFPENQLLFTLRHDPPLTAMAYTADGKFIVTAAGNGGVGEDDATVSETGSTGATGARGATGASSSGRSSGPRTVVQAWDAQKGQPAGDSWDVSYKVEYVAGLPSGALLATAFTSETNPRGYTSVVSLWRRGKSGVLSRGMDCRLDRIAFNDSGNRLLVACLPQPDYRWAVFDVTLRDDTPLSDAVFDKPVVPFTKSYRFVFSSDGRRAAGGMMNGDVQIWDTLTGKPVGPPSRQEGGVVRLAFSPDGSRVYSADRSSHVVVYDSATGKRVGNALESGTPVRRMAQSSDGRTLLGVRDAEGARTAIPGFFSRWDLVTGKRTDTPVTGTRSVIFFPLPDSNLILERPNPSQLGLWDAVTGLPVSHAGAVPGVRRSALSPDGRQMLTWEGGGAVHAWALGATGNYPGMVSARETAISRNGVKAVFLTSRRTLLVRSFQSAVRDQTFSLGFDAATILISSNGDFVAATGDTAAQVWDTRNGAASSILPLTSKGDFQAAVRDDGALLARPGDTLLIAPWGAGAFHALEGVPAPGGTNWAESLSPWGSYFGYLKDGLRVWDTRTGSAKAYPNITTGAPYFSADERFLFVSAENTAPRIVELSAGKITSLNHDGARVAVSPDGRYAATVSDEPELRIWTLDNRQQIGNQRLGANIYYFAFGSQGEIFIATRFWCHWFPPNGAQEPRINLPLPATWNYQSLQFGFDGSSVRALLTPRSTRSWPVELQPSYASLTPLSGDTEELRKKWQKKLNLKIVSGEVSPIYEAHLAPSEAPRKQQ